MVEDELCEGIKVRARIEERLQGGKVSNYLLGKEKNPISSISKIVTEEGVCLSNSDIIENRVFGYYRDLYEKHECDSRMQDSFLELIDKVIDKDENEILRGKVTETEILKVITSMKTGKTPGIDGLPVEFYKTMWHTIKKEFVIVIRCIFEKLLLCKDMNKGVIKLVPKNKNKYNVNNLRPITLLNVDYKIVTKIIANRLKKILPMFISPEQFCGVPGRSITDVNTTLRDMIYYVN